MSEESSHNGGTGCYRHIIEQVRRIVGAQMEQEEGVRMGEATCSGGCGDQRDLAFVVTDEKVGDITCTEKPMDIVMAAGHDVGTLLADAGYDSKENRNHYSRMGIRVCMNINSTKISEKHAVKYP